MRIWCLECDLRTINEPASYIYCAPCLAEYHNHLGVPPDWTALSDINEILVRFEDEDPTDKSNVASAVDHGWLGPSTPRTPG